MEKVTLTTMSVKTANFNPKQIFAQPEADRKEMAVGKIIGIARSIKFGENTKTGDVYQALLGEFVAISYSEPERQYLAGKLFLPEGLHDLIVNAVIGEGIVSDKGRPQYNDVEFAVEIIVAPASNPIGYSYKAKMLVDAKPSDPLMALLDKVGGAPALPAPAPEAEKKAKK